MNLYFSTRRSRTLLLISAVWGILSLAIAFSKGEYCPSERCFFSVADFATTFLFIGALPILLLWGIKWVLAVAPMDANSKQVKELMSRSAVAQSPACPACGSPTTLRTARTGQYAGTYFWGCTNYPDCVRIVPLTISRS